MNTYTPSLNALRDTRDIASADAAAAFDAWAAAGFPAHYEAHVETLRKIAGEAAAAWARAWEGTIETANASRIDWLANRAPQWGAK